MLQTVDVERELHAAGAKPGRPGHAAGWTEGRVDQLKQLWADGWSAKQIAAELGSVTRNAVIGKVHRLGLSGRSKMRDLIKRLRARKRVPMRTVHVVSHGTRFGVLESVDPGPLAEAAEDLAIPLAQPKTLLELERGDCRWPVGDVGEPGFFFCGAPAAPERPYCKGHCRCAYQKRDAAQQQTRRAA